MLKVIVAVLAWRSTRSDGAPASVVYNGVSMNRFEGEIDQGAVKKRYGIGPLDPTVLFCGRLVQQKGPDLMIEGIPPVLSLEEGR